MDLSAYETEQKQREQLVAKVRELQEKNMELQKVAILSQKVCLISSKKRADPCVSALKFVI